MILEAIFSLLLFIPKLIFSLIPTISIEIPENVFAGVSGVIGVVAYLFPIGALLPILVLSLTLDSARIIMAIIVRIKSFIPGMGS